MRSILNRIQTVINSAQTLYTLSLKKTVARE